MVTALFIASLVAVGLLVAALAVYLIWIILLLRQIRQTVGLVIFGVRSIAHRAEPVGELVGEINADLGAVRDALRATVEKATTGGRKG